MKAHRLLLAAAVAAFAVACDNPQAVRSPSPSLGTTKAPTGTMSINIALKVAPSAAILGELATYGKVFDVIAEINAVVLRAPADQLSAIQALPYVEVAGPDAERTGAPLDAVSATNFANGVSTWDLDASNVTERAPSRRVVTEDGTGVWVGVLDTGLLDSWRTYFPQERIASQYATAFGGGGAGGDNASEQPNKWEHDQNSHGTHVTSTILGYSLGGTPINGMAPRATVIPVKVLNQNGSGWSSAIARGIVYVTNLKRNELHGAPTVINMSLGGGVLDPVEKAAIDYAIANGVIIVAAAGNGGTAGMGYPGAYKPVISAAALGWRAQFTSCNGAGAGSWWNACSVKEQGAEGGSAADYYVASFSARPKAGQELDVASPGAWAVGPYQVNSATGKQSYFYLSGTSMASPHVAGIAALMVQRNPALRQAKVECILKNTALAIGASPAITVAGPGGAPLGVPAWDNQATGSGLVTADAALAGVSTTPSACSAL